MYKLTLANVLEIHQMYKLTLLNVLETKCSGISQADLLRLVLRHKPAQEFIHLVEGVREAAAAAEAHGWRRRHAGGWLPSCMLSVLCKPNCDSAFLSPTVSFN